MHFQIKCSIDDFLCSREKRKKSKFFFGFRSHGDPSPSAVGEQLTTVIPRAVYDYAAVVHERLESPRRAKLGHDVNAVLGSSDPPAGFGFLHPRFYYLEQKRPVPMEPLRVCQNEFLLLLLLDNRNFSLIGETRQDEKRKRKINFYSSV